MTNSAVIVEHCEKGEWALVLVAMRTATGKRTLTAMIFVNDGTGVFATCPHTKGWAQAGHIQVFEPPEARRDEMLKNAVSEFVAHVAREFNVLDRSRVGIVARVKSQAAKFNDAPPGFELKQYQEPAYAWLFERSEIAVDAMRVLRVLIKQHYLGELTQAEREGIGERLIRKGH